VWNYLLDGKDNFAVDRQLGEALRSAHPGIVAVAQAQRRFLIQAVTLLAGEVGIRQASCLQRGSVPGAGMSARSRGCRAR